MRKHAFHALQSVIIIAHDFIQPKGINSIDLLECFISMTKLATLIKKPAAEIERNDYQVIFVIQGVPDRYRKNATTNSL